MKHYLLVHGAWHGAWAWEETKRSLEGRGHHVITIDLPGHGSDTTPISGISFRGYVDAVKARLSMLSGRHILVGHSLGGAVVSQAAEEMPHAVEAVVVVAGFVLRANESTLDVMKDDAASDLLSKLIFSADQSSATVSAETVQSHVYNGGTAEQIGRAAPQLRPQATEPFFAHTTLGAAFSGLRRLYVECTDDRVLSLDMQRKIQERCGMSRLATLASGHVASITRPRELADALASV
jgi:pimeloyl-ACP methyl ester carboxylesterase